MDKVKIIGIVGSLRADSFNRAALNAVQDLLPDEVVFSLMELHDIPIYNQDEELKPPAAVVEFKRRILAADAVLFATPEYNYSVPGVLKNAIDWGSRPYGESAWKGKPAAIVGASPGKFGTVRAQYHLRQILSSLDMPVVNQPEVMIANADKAFDSRGKLIEDKSRQLLQQLVLALVELTLAHRVRTDLELATAGAE